MTTPPAWPEPTPTMFDYVLDGGRSGERRQPQPFPMGTGRRYQVARYLWGDGSYIEVTPVPGGIEVRSIDQGGSGHLVIRPHTSDTVSLLQAEDPLDGNGALHLPGGYTGDDL